MHMRQHEQVLTARKLKRKETCYFLRMKSKQSIVILLLAIFFKTTDGFLLDIEICPSLHQCKCYDEYVKCSNQNMPRIPSFNISKQYSMSFLNIQHNRIFVVPPGAFMGIQAKSMYIDLSYNNIHDIHDDAFDGVESAITILKLNNNGLRILPDTLANLTNLFDLEIQNNPIKTFSDIVMSALGPLLEVLTMGSAAMTAWPKEFQHLTKLNTLKVFNIALDDLPDDAFVSSADALKNLQIENTWLSQVPTAICDLSSLEAFQFNNNKNLSESDTVMPNCSSPLETVTSARFAGNDLTEMPDIFHDFPNLTTLYVVGNNDLRTTNWKTIPQDMTLSNLYLYGNGLRMFPSDVGSIQTLKFLDLHDNNITLLHKADVKGLTNLLKLNLNGNPLRYIELDTLQNLPSLLYLSLDNTNLKAIPQAITLSKSLNTISLKHDNVRCTCDALTWLQYWKRRNNVAFIGKCGSLSYQQSIQEYVTILLPRC